MKIWLQLPITRLVYMLLTIEMSNGIENVKVNRSGSGLGAS